MTEYVLSDCCDSRPAGELFYEDTMTGFCGHCYDTCGVYWVEQENHFDTREEQYGER